jgi:hypothetical protein
MTDTQQRDDEAFDDHDLEDEIDDDVEEWDEYNAEDDFDVDYEDFLDWLNRRS